MRIPASKLVSLLLIVCIAIFIAVTLARGYQLENLKNRTISSLSWSGGSPDDQRLLNRLRSYIADATRTDLLSPTIASITFYPFQDDLNVGVDWIALRPTVDTIRLTFSDGSTHEITIPTDELLSHQRQFSKTLFFETSFSEFDVPAAIRPKLTDGLTSVMLVSSGIPCTENGMPPTYIDVDGFGSRAVEWADNTIQFDP